MGKVGKLGDAVCAWACVQVLARAGKTTFRVITTVAIIWGITWQGVQMSSIAGCRSVDMSNVEAGDRRYTSLEISEH